MTSGKAQVLVQRCRLVARGWSIMGAFLLALLLPGAAGAEPLLGAFAIQGDVMIPPATLGSGTVLAMMVPPDVLVGMLELTAPTTMVTRHEWRIQEVAAGDRHVTHVMGYEEASFPLREVQLTLAPGSHTGLVFVEADDALITLPNRTRIAAIDERQFGASWISTEERDDPRRPFVPLSAPSLALTGDAIVVTGRLTLYLFGPDVDVVARENTTRMTTGSSTERTLPAERVDRALVLQAEGTLRVAGAIETRADRLHGVLEGLLEAAGATGDMHDEKNSYSGAGEPLLLQGRFETKLTPKGPDRLDLMILDGELAATSLAKTPTARTPLSGLGFYATLGVALAGVVTGAAVLTRRRRGADRRVEVEDLVWRAEEAIEENRLLQAQGLLRHALELAPGSSRVRFDLAYLAWRSGQAERALALLGELEDSGDSCDAKLLKARILLNCGMHEAAALTLVRMLDEAPTMVLELDDPEFLALEDHADLQRAVGRARRVFGDQ